jgi:curli biogenesis system outer membrane secretion channel CsgG
MRFWLSILALALITIGARAQSQTAPRLAIVVEDPDANTAGDILTATLSQKGSVQLVERAEIEKVFREQALAAQNRNYLKLGQILGADGVLLLEVVETKQATNSETLIPLGLADRAPTINLATRLIAVKPGIVLTDGTFEWSQSNALPWAESVAAYLDSFLPKLTVQAKDAIPISVVNLRSAVPSAGAAETERLLKLLAIHRLSREREFFVLERQKLQLLSDEKEINADASAFWNGSYLLEAVMDQNGYSAEKMTLNARLTPSHGGPPLLIEVNGARTNLSGIISQLVAKIRTALKINSSSTEWNSAEEAQQFLNEAKWALQWNVISEAEADADSAWALGKKDLECASVRVEAYTADILKNVGGFHVGPVPEAEVRAAIQSLRETHPEGFGYTQLKVQGQTILIARLADHPPDPRNIDLAEHTLDLYEQFSRISTDGEPKVTFVEKTALWKNSEWYNRGIEALSAASQVLQDFSVCRVEQRPAEKLADLRARARSVAAGIDQSPTVRDSFFTLKFIGGPPPGPDQMRNLIGDNKNIFACEAMWSCFWQEKPEDTFEVYRKLMASPLFPYLHEKIWIRESLSPRLMAWNDPDRARVPRVWEGFLRELETSTNVLLQLEAKAFRLADADGVKVGAAFTNLFESIVATRQSELPADADLFRWTDGTFPLVEESTRLEIAGAAQESMRHWYYAEFRPKLEAMRRDWEQDREKAVALRKSADTFEKAKQYLKSIPPFDFFEFNKVIDAHPNYSRAEAIEILPLLSAYRSNLIAQTFDAALSTTNKLKMQSGVQWLKFREDLLRRSMDPATNSPALANTRAPVASPQTQNRNASPRPPAPEPAANILLVENYSPVPDGPIAFTGPDGASHHASFQLNASRWVGDKWLLQGSYTDPVSSTQLVAIAMFDADHQAWELIHCPTRSVAGDSVMVAATLYQTSMELFNGELYLSDNARCDVFNFKTRQWQTLNLPGLNNSELFALDKHLYAASGESILEILDGGSSTRVLASTRRRPALSALDSKEELGRPILFSTPDRPLNAIVGNQIFAWNGNDWTERFPLNFSRADVLENAVVFHFKAPDRSGTLWIWDKIQPAPELAEVEKSNLPFEMITTRPAASSRAKPLWTAAADSLLEKPPATLGSNLCFLVDHATITNASGKQIAVEKDGYHARLICLDRETSAPMIVPLRFDSRRGPPPLAILDRASFAAFRPSGPKMLVHNHTLFISQLNPPGVWAIPADKLDAILASRKKPAITNTMPTGGTP